MSEAHLDAPAEPCDSENAWKVPLWVLPIASLPPFLLVHAKFTPVLHAGVFFYAKSHLDAAAEPCDSSRA